MLLSALYTVFCLPQPKLTEKTSFLHKYVSLFLVVLYHREADPTSGGHLPGLGVIHPLGILSLVQEGEVI